LETKEWRNDDDHDDDTNTIVNCNSKDDTEHKMAKSDSLKINLSVLKDGFCTHYFVYSTEVEIGITRIEIINSDG
jgi:hypothetical protein